MYENAYEKEKQFVKGVHINAEDKNRIELLTTLQNARENSEFKFKL